MPRRAVALIVFAALSASVPASAQVCHPDPAGTRTLLIHGSVTGYALHGIRVVLSYTTHHCAQRTSWKLATAPMRTVAKQADGCKQLPRLGDAVRVPATPPALPLNVVGGDGRALVGATTITLFDGSKAIGSIHRTTQRPPLKAAIDEGRLVVLVQGSVSPERPEQLEVYDTTRATQLGAWPLVVPAVTLDLSGDLAIFATYGRAGVYAIRLHDGAMRFIAPAWTGDSPQIGRAGIVYEDGTFARDRARNRVPVKFVPTRAVEGEFAETSRTMQTDGSVTGLSVDGPNVAVTFKGSGSECEQVRIWQVFWQDVAQPTEDRGVGCLPGGRIQGLAETGIVARWVAKRDGPQRLVWSSSEDCTQHLIAEMRPHDRMVTIAGEGGVLAYGMQRADGSATAVTYAASAAWHSHTIRLDGVPRMLAVDDDHIAILNRKGMTSVASTRGKVETSVGTGNATAISLRGDSLFALTGRELKRYDLETRQVASAWTFPAKPTSLSVRYGIAVVTTHHDVIALRISDGRRAVLAHTGNRPLAEIDTAGVAIASTSAGHGTVRFVPLADILRALAG